MPKMSDLRFALAVTKSNVSASSLSNVRIGAELPTSAFARKSSSRLLNRRKLSTNTAKFSAVFHATWSCCATAGPHPSDSCSKVS
jgi:hypothetical protein